MFHPGWIHHFHVQRIVKEQSEVIAHHLNQCPRSLFCRSAIYIRIVLSSAPPRAQTASPGKRAAAWSQSNATTQDWGRLRTCSRVTALAGTMMLLCRCSGIIVAVATAESPQECQSICLVTDGCAYFTFDVSNGACTMTEDCSEAACATCVYGPATCAEPSTPPPTGTSRPWSATTDRHLTGRGPSKSNNSVNNDDINTSTDRDALFVIGGVTDYHYDDNAAISTTDDVSLSDAGGLLRLTSLLRASNDNPIQGGPQISAVGPRDP